MLQSVLVRRGWRHALLNRSFWTRWSRSKEGRIPLRGGKDTPLGDPLLYNGTWSGQGRPLNCRLSLYVDRARGMYWDTVIKPGDRNTDPKDTKIKVGFLYGLNRLVCFSLCRNVNLYGLLDCKHLARTSSIAKKMHYSQVMHGDWKIRLIQNRPTLFFFFYNKTTILFFHIDGDIPIWILHRRLQDTGSASRFWLFIIW